MEIAATIIHSILAAFILVSMVGFAVAFGLERERKAALICTAAAATASR